jgi:SAM-dependent methyltransferase
LVRRVSAPPATVVTVGAGASTLVGALLDDGYQVIAVDLAPAALEQLSRQLADGATGVDHLQLLERDVQVLELDDQVDVWHDRAVFHFLVDATDQAAYVRAACAAVRPGGHLLIATFSPDGPTSCSGLPVARHDRTSLEAAFAPGFEVVESFEVDHMTPWSSPQRFTHATLRRQ